MASLPLSPAMLADAIGCTPRLAALWAAPLSAAMRIFQIDTEARMAAFLAQVGHESGSLRWVREIWGPTPAQKRYEGRADLGNTEPGDGHRFRGRGLIQITGRWNYAAVADALHIDCVRTPELLEQPEHAAMSAAWFWVSRDLNRLADVGEFDAITQRINGGQNGASDRRDRWARARAALARDTQPQPAPANPPAPVEEMPPMPLPAFAAAALPELIKHAPELFRIFGGDHAEQNAQAAEIVADIATTATGEPTVEGAVDRIRSDPRDAAQFRAAVRDRFADLLRLAEADEKSRDAALSRNQVLMAADPRWLWIVGGIAVAVVLASYLLAYVVITGEFAPEVKSMVITGVVIASLATVLAFLFGSSHGSRLKDSRK